MSKYVSALLITLFLAISMNGSQAVAATPEGQNSSVEVQIALNPNNWTFPANSIVQLEVGTDNNQQQTIPVKLSPDGHPDSNSQVALNISLNTVNLNATIQMNGQLILDASWKLDLTNVAVTPSSAQLGGLDKLGVKLADSNQSILIANLTVFRVAIYPDLQLAQPPTSANPWQIQIAMQQGNSFGTPTSAQASLEDQVWVRLATGKNTPLYVVSPKNQASFRVQFLRGTDIVVATYRGTMDFISGLPSGALADPTSPDATRVRIGCGTVDHAVPLDLKMPTTEIGNLGTEQPDNGTIIDIYRGQLPQVYPSITTPTSITSSSMTSLTIVTLDHEKLTAIAGARLKLTQGDISFLGLSNDQGLANLGQVPLGKYVIQVNADGYPSVQEVLDISGTGSVRHSVEMERKTKVLTRNVGPYLVLGISIAIVLVIVGIVYLGLKASKKPNFE